MQKYKNTLSDITQQHSDMCLYYLDHPQGTLRQTRIHKTQMTY